MITKTLSLLAAVAFTLGCLGGADVSAQSSPLVAQNGRHDEPLQMTIDYGNGKEKRRQSHHGVMEPVGSPVGQPVRITLNFLRKRAGDVVQIIPRDGGLVNLATPATISADGTLTFTFQTGQTTGLYRLAVNGPQQYELSLYGIDPNRPAPSSRN